MPKSNHQDKYFQLRDAYPTFTYEGFDYKLSPAGLEIQYHFNLSDKFAFNPTIDIPSRTFYNLDQIKGEHLIPFIFSIGMVELISYWKAACSPLVIIKNFTLDQSQMDWWKKLYFHGLGEFFYLNSIETDIDSFMEIKCEGTKVLQPNHFSLQPSTIVPVGGGKDSVVTLELISKIERPLPLIMNPRAATIGCVMQRGYDRTSIIEINRSIDPQLLELNKQGFLNGHTPFSAILAFTSALTAILSGRKYIALSNESSANESTIQGTMINHQYSKSFEFEQDFRNYLHANLTPDIEYYSFLRPLSELQIASLFAKFPHYFPVFKSCNVGSKTDSWCGRCPKCLFTWIILSPFIEQEQLRRIFNKDLLKDVSLIPHLQELIGIAATKPFECIGTVSEVKEALDQLMANWAGGDLPPLLQYYANSSVSSQGDANDLALRLTKIEPQHFVPEAFLQLILDSLHD